MALENNIDVEVSRYAYPLADASLMSAQASNGAGVSYDPAITSTVNWARNALIQTNSVTAGGQTKNFTVSGYVFFPKGQYSQVEMLLVDRETGDTQVVREPWH